jgi:oxalate---CoA ligase
MNRTVISSKIRDHALGNPDKIAINFKDQVVLTYQRFIQMYDLIQNRLTSFDIDRADRLMVFFESRVNYLLAVLPLVESASFTSSEMTSDLHVLEEKTDLYKITCLVTDTISESLIKFASEEGLGLICLKLTQNSSLVSVELIVKGNRTVYPASNVDDLALLTQTSGTTATPKLIPKSYGLLVENCIQEHEVYDVDENQVRLMTAPLHRTNTSFSVMKYLYSNAQVICSDGANHPMVLQLLMSAGVTHLRSAPASLSSLMDYIEINQIKPSCPQLKYIFVPGAAINDRFVQRVKIHFEAELIHTYGSTETSNITSNYKLATGYRSGSVGVATYHDLKIIDGEICAMGRTVFQGYENADNREFFIDGYFRTGDAGYLDDDGYLYISGRIKEMINRGGEKVSPYELEKEIENLGIFKEHVIFPYPGENLFEEIGLAGVLIDGHPAIKLSDVRLRLMSKVPSFKLPTKLIIVDEIPKSSNNKIQRKQLYSLLLPYFTDEIIVETERSEDLSGVERVLCDLHKKILKLSQIELSDNFIALGGDSLKAAELYSEIETAYGVRLPMVDLFACDNVKEMASFIERYFSKERKYKYIVPLVNGDDLREPIVFVHAVAGDAITYRHLASKITSDRSIYAIEFNITQSNWNLPPDPDQILDDYIEELLMLRPEGNFIFSGLSMGGRIALEIAHRLCEKGFSESRVIMLDTVFVKGNKHGKRLILSRSIRRAILDIKTKRHGNIVKYVSFKVQQFVKNRLAKKEVRDFLRAIVHKKMSSYDRNFSPAEIEMLISTYFKTPIRDFYDIKVIYLLAKREENTANSEFIAARVRDFSQIELDCYHSDFVSVHADETAKILTTLI